MPMLTRQEMEAEIDSGRSILMPDGTILTKKEQLPSDAALAARTGDRAHIDRAAQELVRQMLDIQRQMALLPGTPPAPEAPAPVNSDSPAPESKTEEKPQEEVVAEHSAQGGAAPPAEFVPPPEEEVVPEPEPPGRFGRRR